jgi:hypothetical protein
MRCAFPPYDAAPAGGPGGELQISELSTRLHRL